MLAIRCMTNFRLQVRPPRRERPVCHPEEEGPGGGLLDGYGNFDIVFEAISQHFASFMPPPPIRAA